MFVALTVSAVSEVKLDIVDSWQNSVCYYIC